LVPQPKRWGTCLPRSLRLLRLWKVLPYWVGPSHLLATVGRSCLWLRVGKAELAENPGEAD